MRRGSDLYKKVVYWSDEDGCFVGTCPELMFGGVHGDDPVAVFRELNVAAEEAVEILKQEGKIFPRTRNLTFEAAWPKGLRIEQSKYYLTREECIRKEV